MMGASPRITLGITHRQSSGKAKLPGMPISEVSAPLLPAGCGAGALSSPWVSGSREYGTRSGEVSCGGSDTGTGPSPPFQLFPALDVAMNPVSACDESVCVGSLVLDVKRWSASVAQGQSMQDRLTEQRGQAHTLLACLCLLQPPHPPAQLPTCGQGLPR